MAFFLAKFFKGSFFRSFKVINLHIQKRNLFSSEILGIENYLRQKELMISKLGSVRDKFMERMANYIAESETNTIFTDDMKMGVYLVESDQELETIVSMIKRFHRQNDALKFSAFVFGPLVMRFFHILNKPDAAKDLLFNQNMTDFFSQISSYIVFMDLMFINERYNDVIQAMHHLATHNVQEFGFNMDCLTLYAAACCKLNTDESCETLLNYLQKVKKEYNSTVSMRTVVYGATLALNKDKPEMAFEILSMIHVHKVNKLPIVYANLKLLTFAKLERFDEALSLLKGSTQSDLPATTTSFNAEIFSDILSLVKNEYDNKATKIQQSQLLDAIKCLEKFNRIDSRSFEAYIYTNIEKQRTLQAGFKQRQRPTHFYNKQLKQNDIDEQNSRPRLFDNRLK